MPLALFSSFFRPPYFLSGLARIKAGIIFFRSACEDKTCSRRGGPGARFKVQVLAGQK